MDQVKDGLSCDGLWLPDYIVGDRVSMRLAAPFLPGPFQIISKVIAHEFVDRKLP
jgi:hypothetical protein